MSDKRIQETVHSFEVRAKEEGFFITADGRVGEDQAAKLLGIAPKTLKNFRYDGWSPAHYKKPVSGNHVSYRLIDLAIWLEEARCEG